MGYTAYTEGPWRFDGDWIRFPTIFGANGEKVAIVEKEGFPERDHRTMAQSANAALIAAAPDLVEACFKARHRLLKESFLPEDPTVTAINAALTRALGTALPQEVAGRVRCHDCGRFLSFATLCFSKHHFVPLNEFSPEESWWSCPSCRDDYAGRTLQQEESSNG